MNADDEYRRRRQSAQMQGVSDEEFAAKLAEVGGGDAVAVEAGVEETAEAPAPARRPLVALVRPPAATSPDGIARASAALAQMALAAAGRLGDDEASITVRVSLTALAELHGWNDRGTMTVLR